MALSDITSRDAIEAAVDEFERLGRASFLKKYGFRAARAYHLSHGGKLYPSKAILGAAHSFEFGTPLRPSDFSGGEATVARKLRSLGFEVVTKAPNASALLTRGQVWWENFFVATCRRLGRSPGAKANGTILARGVISPPEVTARSYWDHGGRRRHSDTPRKKALLLTYWEASGRSGHFPARGIPVSDGYIRLDRAVVKDFLDATPPLLAWRNGGFDLTGHGQEEVRRTLGLTALPPASDALAESEDEAEAVGAFDPANVEDGRKRLMAAMVLRRGRRKFRGALLTAYDYRCAVTGCDVPETLEAAHIYPYKGKQTDHVTNGLLLRADCHTLFDLFLLAVDTENWQVIVAPSLLGTIYGDLNGVQLRLPLKKAEHPSKEALDWHRGQADF